MQKVKEIDSFNRMNSEVATHFFKKTEEIYTRILNDKKNINNTSFLEGLLSEVEMYDELCLFDFAVNEIYNVYESTGELGKLTYKTFYLKQLDKFTEMLFTVDKNSYEKVEKQLMEKFIQYNLKLLLRKHSKKELKSLIKFLSEYKKNVLGYHSIIEHIRDGNITNMESALEVDKDNLENILLTDEEKSEYAEKNKGLIFQCSKQMCDNNSDPVEFEGIAQLGFTKALNTFNKNKGVQFSTYSSKCMQNEILAYLRKENKHREHVMYLSEQLSVDKDGNALELENIIPDNSDGDKPVEEKLLRDERAKVLYIALEELSEKEKIIMINRYSLKGAEKKTQKDLADELNMSQANISKIEEKALKNLKTIINKYL